MAGEVNLAPVCLSGILLSLLSFFFSLLIQKRQGVLFFRWARLGLVKLRWLASEAHLAAEIFFYVVLVLFVVSLVSLEKKSFVGSVWVFKIGWMVVLDLNVRVLKFFLLKFFCWRKTRCSSIEKIGKYG